MLKLGCIPPVLSSKKLSALANEWTPHSCEIDMRTSAARRWRGDVWRSFESLPLSNWSRNELPTEGRSLGWLRRRHRPHHNHHHPHNYHRHHNHHPPSHNHHRRHCYCEHRANIKLVARCVRWKFSGKPLAHSTIKCGLSWWKMSSSHFAMRHGSNYPHLVLNWAAYRVRFGIVLLIRLRCCCDIRWRISFV